MWAARRAKPSAWVSNYSSGRKATESAERFVGALSALQPENTALREIAEHKSFVSAPHEFVQYAVKSFRSFCRNGDGYTLVIDDFHLITDPYILKILPNTIRELPESVTLLILSRTEPPDSFSDFVLKNTMAIVDSGHLKFTEEEIRDFFCSCGHKLTLQQAQDLMKTTGGWAIGLNAILLSGNYKEKRFFSRYLETFIREQIWEKWDAARRDFLLRVSVADELTPEFCGAVADTNNSAGILDELVRENAFISVDGDKIYHLHHLFLDFLRNMLERDITQKNAFYKKAGDWSYKCGNCYRAVEYYRKCGDNDGVAKSLGFAYDMDSRHVSIEDTLAIIHLAVNDAILDKYPLLLQVLTWAVCVEGRIEETEVLLDRCYALFADIAPQNPRFALMTGSLRMMDHRLSNYEVPREIAEAPVPLDVNLPPTTPSFTYNLPFIHRCCCDFSEYAVDSENRLYYLRKAWSGVFKDKFEIIEDMIRAGINYERGRLSEAHETALSAIAALRDDSALELQFSVYMLFAAVLDAQGRRDEARKTLAGLEDLISRHGAYFLNANFRAFSCRLELSNGDMTAARDWLRKNDEIPTKYVPFYMLYRYFTTARAYIVTGDYYNAILLLKKILSMIEKCRYRPLDLIEANVLLAIAYWKKIRSSHNDALGFLEKAILAAREYGYSQIFVNEGADLFTMLHKLQKRVIQKDYPGNLSAVEVKTLYFAALVRAKYSPGLTGGRAPENLEFTEQQKTVLRFLRDGITHKEMAEKMGLAPSTIKSHMNLIYKKLDVSNGVDAIIKIQEQNLLGG
ncbi:MAG: LuxR C-terminal-related transcriptional regulator [Oscillospiraceae bacterium]|nr:LuxR C-terminal-related transcriptional regulator [Oscillospiraceae bacterium]